MPKGRKPYPENVAIVQELQEMRPLDVYTIAPAMPPSVLGNLIKRSGLPGVYRTLAHGGRTFVLRVE